MHKVLLPTLLILFLFGCSEQEATEQDMLNIQAATLKGLCENKSACLNKIDTLAESCHQSHGDSRDFDALSDRDQIKSIGGFGACIIRQMDEGFQKRFDQAMPVTETGVKITRPSTNRNPNGLLVRVMQDGIRFTDKSKQRNTDVPIKDLKDYIENQKLAEKYSIVLLFVDKDADTGDMVEVMDIFKNAGIEKIHIAGGNR